MDNLDRYKALQRQPRHIFQTDTTSSGIDAYAQKLAQAQADAMSQLSTMKESQIENPQTEVSPNMPFQENAQRAVQGFELSLPSNAEQSAILPSRSRITQVFGQKSQYDVFSGGVNYGVDFGVKEGTPVGLPPGEWETLDVKSGFKRKGFIGNKDGGGYGNSVMVRNKQTGETLRFSHLSGVNVNPGQIIKGGTVIGKTGATGNVTSAHLDLEYRDPSGKLADVVKSPYSRFIFGGGNG